MMWNGVVAAGAYNARRARLALERAEQRELAAADREAEWYLIMQERDRVWQETVDRMWRMGWEAGYQRGQEDSRG